MSDRLSLWRVVYRDGSVCTEKSRFGFHNSVYGERLRGRGVHIQAFAINTWVHDQMLPVKYAWDGLEFF